MQRDNNGKILILRFLSMVVLIGAVSVVVSAYRSAL